MNKLLFATIGIISCAALLFAFKAKAIEDEKPDYVIMKLFEPAVGGMYPAGLVLSYGKAKTETVDLKKSSMEHAVENAEIILTYLNRLKKEGYKLKSTTGGDYFSTYIFERE